MSVLEVAKLMYTDEWDEHFV